MSAGARFTVIFRAGNSTWEFTIAVRTRSLLSSTDFEGSPTMSNPGSPREAILISTSTPTVSNPICKADETLINIILSSFLFNNSLQFHKGKRCSQLRGRHLQGPREYIGL